jgi:hypothetical protein
MEAIEISPFDLEDSPIQLFGLRQQAGAMKRYGLAEHGCDIRLRER